MEKTSILIEGADERGIARGCYYLEDVMTLNEAPFMDEVKELARRWMKLDVDSALSGERVSNTWVICL